MNSAATELLVDIHRLRRLFVRQKIPKKKIPESRRQNLQGAKPIEVLAHIHADLERLASMVRRGKLVLASHHIGVAKGLYMKAAQTTVEVIVRA